MAHQQSQSAVDFQHSNKLFLKVLEKTSKPMPPWCVAGRRVPEDLNEELSLFAEFMRPSSHEQDGIKRIHADITEAVVAICGKNFAVTPAGVTALGLSLSEGPLFFAVNQIGSSAEAAGPVAAATAAENAAARTTTDSIANFILEQQQARRVVAEQQSDAEDGSATETAAVAAPTQGESIQKKASPQGEVFDITNLLLDRNGGQQQQQRTTVFPDRRGGYALRLKEVTTASMLGRPVVVYIGRCARDARNLADKLAAGFGSPTAQASLPAWQVLLSSLKQTRNCDDFEPSALCSDAAAVMMLSVINSYDAAPSCSQALTDFFLLYGFSSSFDIAQKSITVQGALVDVPKIHAADAISIVDPSSSANANLCSGMTSASVGRLVNVLAYCYRVIAEYSRGRAEQERGRAESTLSTFLGGGPYWSRVVALAQQGSANHVEALTRATERPLPHSAAAAAASAAGSSAMRAPPTYGNGSGNSNYVRGGGGNGYYRGGGGGGYRGGSRGSRGGYQHYPYHHQQQYQHHHHHQQHHHYQQPAASYGEQPHHHQNQYYSSATVSAEPPSQTY